MAEEWKNNLIEMQRKLLQKGNKEPRPRIERKTIVKTIKERKSKIIRSPTKYIPSPFRGGITARLKKPNAQDRNVFLRGFG